MNMIAPLNAASERLAPLVAYGLVGSCILLAAVTLLWLILRKRVSASFGAALFLLVMIKPLVPFELAVPWLSPPAPVVFDSSASTTTTMLVEPAVTATAVVQPSLTGGALLFLAWASVSTALLAALAVNQGRLVAWCRRATPLSSHQGELDRLSSEAGVRPPRLLSHPAATTPFVCGLFSPKLVVPDDFFSSLSQDKRRWVLFHELAHLKRRDLWTLTFQRFTKSLFFFNPAVWIASRQVDRLREFACDDFALTQSKTAAQTCGESFLAVIERASTPALPGAAALAITESKTSYKDRLNRILDTGRTPAPRLSLTGLGFLAIAAIACLPNLTAQSPSAGLDPSPAGLAPATDAAEPDTGSGLSAATPATVDNAAPASFRIAILKDGSIITSAIDGTNGSKLTSPVDPGDLPGRLAELKKHSPKRPVQISATKDTPFDQITSILDHCSRLGITNISFASRNDRLRPPPAEAAAAEKPALHPRNDISPRTRQFNVLSTSLAGTVTEVMVADGARVEKGQILLKLDPRDAELKVRIAEARVEEAKADYEVQETVLQASMKKVERLEKLADKSLVSTSEIDDATTLANKSRALLTKARASLDIAFAELRQQEVIFERHSVRAPTAGTVGPIHAYPGQIITPGTKLISFEPAMEE